MDALTKVFVSLISVNFPNLGRLFIVDKMIRFSLSLLYFKEPRRRPIVTVTISDKQALFKLNNFGGPLNTNSN